VCDTELQVSDAPGEVYKSRATSFPAEILKKWKMKAWRWHDRNQASINYENM